MLILLFSPDAGAYEFTLTEVTADSYVYLYYQNWAGPGYGEDEVWNPTSASAHGTVSHTDGSTWDSYRSVGSSYQRTRSGDDVTTTATFNLLARFTGASDDVDLEGREASGPTYTTNFAEAFYYLTIQGEPGSQSINPSADIHFNELTQGFGGSNILEYGRRFLIDRWDGSSWIPKLAWSNPFPSESAHTSFWTDTTYLITAQIWGLDNTGETWGDFDHFVDSTVTIEISEILPVPEPATWALLAAGGLLLTLRRRRLRTR